MPYGGPLQTPASVQFFHKTTVNDTGPAPHWYKILPLSVDSVRLLKLAAERLLRCTTVRAGH